jgi:hypothetical protein
MVMNKDLVTYIENVLHLRDSFSLISRVDKESEAMKIWARWIITHRSLCAQSNLYLPDDNVYDYQILLELQDKGVTLKYSKFLYEWLRLECNKINNKYTLISTMEEGGIHGYIPIKESRNISSKSISLTCNNMKQILPLSVYNRMSRLYRSKNSLPCMKNKYIWLCTTLYSLLDGKGLQWAVPPKIMNILQRDLGCYTELFASPLNAYNENYYSLFTFDSAFGSRGNFYEAKDQDFVEGTYQVNPPFIDPLFTKTTERVLELLDIADKNNKELTFIYIMPEWKDFQTYNMVSEARFCVKQILLSAYSHFYYQYDTGAYIRARFGSYIFFLSTNTKCCPHSLEREIRQGFSSRN